MSRASLDGVLKPYTIRKEIMKPNREVFVVDATKIRDVFQAIKDNLGEDFYLATIAGVDKPKEGIFELDYFVHIISQGRTFVIRTTIPRDNAKIDTIVDIVPGAFSPEAEIYDLLGIEFVGNKNLRRPFFAPADIVSQGVYPLRKDVQV